LFVQLDETLQLGIDCVAPLSPDRVIVFGWTMVPRGVEADLTVTAGTEAMAGVLHASFHPRPDVLPGDPLLAVVNGFTLLLDAADQAAGLVMTLSAGEALVRADLRDARVETDLLKATAARSWRVTFGLLEECAGNPELAALLRYRNRPLGAFADWLGGLPVVRGRAANYGRIAEVEALALPSGEVLAMLRAGARLPPEASLRAALVGWLPGEAGNAAVPSLLRFTEWHAARLPAALAGYGIVEGGMAGRLQSVEIILLAEPEPGEEIWLRCQPARATLPDLLDAASRGSAASLATPIEAAGAAALDLLGAVIQRREAAFAPLLGSLATPAASAPHSRTALLLGADDPAVARLFHVTADLVAAHCDTLLVLGGAAEDVAQAFAAPGRPKVLVGDDAEEALRLAAARGGVIAVDAAAFAEAVIAGTPDEAFRTVLAPADLTRARALHAVAGCMPALADTLQRLLRGRRADGPVRPGPLQRSWTNRHAAEPANAHLQRLWSAAFTEGAPHG
jgi:hypothetical protein